jgi:2-polyprenyl-6-hydroxyphenyl methylase/3-demethylubiquinone-9 3-methyltransferase
MTAPRAARAPGPRPANPTTADAEEVARFEALAESWWDPTGPFRPLHKLNPVRLLYIRDRLAAHFGRAAEKPSPLADLRVLDVGCGGGILCEPLSRLGASVVGIDAAEGNIAVAALHARRGGHAIDYRAVTPEILAAEVAAGSTDPFDAVISLEVIEHVADTHVFLGALAGLLAPDGALVMSTLNRTLKSLLLAKIGAEYVLRWLPVGTHDWGKFVKPAELRSGLEGHAIEIRDLCGVVYDPLGDSWRLGRDADVNYMIFAARPGTGRSA